MRVAVKDIRPNPHRDVKHYKLRQDVLDELRESIETTNFWDNLLCRRHNGRIECAYGHHRLAALRNAKGFGPNFKIDVAIKDLSDADMLRIMYRENHDVYGGRVDTTMEGVKKVVEGYAEGSWDLPKPSRTKPERIRNAPKYATSTELGDVEKPYTATTIAMFLGVEKRITEVNKIKFALQALQAVEEKIIRRSDIKGQTSKGAAAIVTEARRAAHTVAGKRGVDAGKRAARTVATKIAKGLRGGKHGYLAARGEARKIVKQIVPKGTPWIDEMAREVGGSLSLLLTPNTDLGKKIAALVSSAPHLNDTSWNRLVGGLENLSERSNKLLERLQANKERNLLK